MKFLVVEKSTDYVFCVFDVIKTDTGAEFLLFDEETDTWSYKDADDYYAYNGGTNTLSRVYKPVTLNNMIFESNGGTNIEVQIIELPNLVVKPDDPIKEGFIFGGWYTDDETFIDAFDFDNEIIDEETTIYAKWTAITYTATFDTNGGSEVEPQTIAYNGKIIKPAPNPTKEGFIALLWQTDEELTIGYDFDEIVTEDITLYLSWATEVTFDSNGGSAVTSLYPKVGYPVSEPEAPTKEGFTFDGWFKDDETFLEAFDFEAPITVPTTAYAKWIEVSIEG